LQSEKLNDNLRLRRRDATDRVRNRPSRSATECPRPCGYDFFFSVSLSFGADPDGVGGTSSSSSIAITGGLVASGDGPWVLPKASEGLGRRAIPPTTPSVPKLKLADGIEGEAAGGLLAGGVGTAPVPELNSAQRGHLRLVFMWPICPQWPQRLVVSGLTGRLSCMGVPPSFTIFAFFR